MNSFASARGTPSCAASANGPMPYSTPKLIVFALRLWSAVTAPGAIPKIFAAVARWMSSPRRKTSISASSPERCARSRSSICE